MSTKQFSELGLSSEVLKAIDKLGFEQASPIQTEAIPLLMQGHDLVGQSQTGSGKTAAFGIPAIEKTDPQLRAVQVLILCPTRELAVQVSEEIYKLASFKHGIRELPIYGGQSYDRQFQGLRQGAQIVIGTPGRVMDHMRRATLRLDKVRMVILDEADVMLNMGFREDIEFILQGVPKERQTVFFSATFPKPIQDLIQKYSRDPRTVRIERKELTVPTVEQTYYEVERRFKVELLTRIIDLYDLKLGIIFCNTKRMVDDLVEHLNAQGYSADRLHGDMTQVMRDRVMNRFRKSGLEFLVATDVAARGIDVENVEVVFNYDLPYDVEDYLHRIGRTGRAGRSGRAIAFASGREVFQIRQIERFTNVKMQRGKPPSAQDVENALANLFLDRIRTTLKSADIRKHEPMVERLLEEGFSSTDVACGLLQLLQAGEAAAPGQTAGVESRPAARPDMERKKERYQSDRTPNFDKRPREQHTAVPRFQPAIKPAPRPAEVTERPKKLKPEQQPIRPAPEAKTPPPEERTEPKKESSPQTAAKPSRRTPEEQTRLFMNVGAEMGIGPDDVVGTILGETGLPANIVGAIDVRERHLFVDVATEHSKAIIAKLNRTQIKNRKLKVKIA